MEKLIGIILLLFGIFLAVVGDPLHAGSEVLRTILAATLVGLIIALGIGLILH